jgi:hypothetical protein
MRFLLRQPPPTLPERLLGRRRVRVLRRRLGFVAVGLGLTLLRPKPRVRLMPVLVVLGALVFAAAAVGVGLPT